MEKTVISFFLLFFSSATYAAQEKNDTFPSLVYDYTTALEHLDSIKSSLNSYTEMTELADSKLKEKVGNTSWEIQNIGFPNWTNYVQGTLLKQNLKIAELEREKASTQEDILRAQDYLEHAQKEYENFIQRHQVVD